MVRATEQSDDFEASLLDLLPGQLMYFIRPERLLVVFEEADFQSVPFPGQVENERSVVHEESRAGSREASVLRYFSSIKFSLILPT